MSKEPIDKLAASADISDEDWGAFKGMINYVGDVQSGRKPKPGGALCVFPHCFCSQPTVKCERRLRE